jgi:hypothetical protein
MKNLLRPSLYFGLFLLLLVVGRHIDAKKARPVSAGQNSQTPLSTAQDVQPPGRQAAEGSPLELNEKTRNQLYALMLEKQARTPVQDKIDSQLIMAAKIKRHEEVAPGIAMMATDVVYDTKGRQEVDISGEVTENLLETIRREGGEVVNSYPQFKAVRAYITPESLETIAGLSEVRVVSRASQVELSQTGQAVSSHPTTTLDERVQQVQEKLSAALPKVVAASPAPSVERVGHAFAQAPLSGNVTSEGDVTHAADQARSSFGVTGAGIKIGVISDSVKFLSQSQASGDLGTVTVLSGRSGVDGGSNDTGEGTAMLEIVHDLAPGAQLFFSTGKGGSAAFAQNILDLRAAGCNIIVDDLEYLDESPFQDAVVAQAVNTVTAAGALYFSSAGNSGNFNDQSSSVWEGDFIDGGPISYNGSALGNAHRFFAPNVIFNQTFTNDPHGESAYLFWSDPLAGSANDYDLYIVDTSGAIVRFSNNTQNGTQDPVESISIANGEHVLVVKFSGASRYLHVNVGRGRFTYQKPGRTKGHSAAVGAFSVAAVKARTSFPNVFLGGDQNPVETYSSDGPRRVFYTANGTPITPGNVSATGGAVRAKPDIAAADGVSTSVPGFGTFSGTSAAAPHAAAIAALLLSLDSSLTPTQVRTALTNTALDIEAPGADRDSGSGIVMALQALQAATSCPSISISPGQTVNGALTTSDCIFTGTTRYVDVYNFSGISGQQIAISMSSTAFDTYLYLLDSGNHLVTQDDDGGGNTNSRIPAGSGFFTLPASGNYTIYAASFSADGLTGGTGTYSLSLSASNCTFSLNPTSQIFIASAGNGSFSVSTTSTCAWSAVSNSSWLSTTSSGVGNGTVNYSVAANTGNSRTGSINVAGQAFTVFQSAGNGNGCPSTTIVPGQTINTTLTTGCVFTGTSRYVDLYNFSGTAGQQIFIAMSSGTFDTYLFLDSPSSQTIAQDDDGGGGTNSRIPANAGFLTLPSSGSYRIFATSFSASGATGSTGSYSISLLNPTSCSYSISPSAQSIAAAGGAGSFGISTSSGCAWTALSNATWITTNSSGSGNGTINYAVAANSGAARAGTISAGGQLFTVNQSAGGQPQVVQLSAPSYSINEGGQVLNINVTRTNGTTGTASVNFMTSDLAGSQGCNVLISRASSRCDYITSVGTLNFAAGESSKAISVLIVDDSYAEGNETFTLTLSSPSGAVLGAQTTATVTLVDNDSTTGANKVDQASFFVNEHYFDFLNRQPDPGGLAFWTNEITSCGSNQACIDLKRINVSAAYFLSIEFQQTGYLVERLYRAAYGSGTGTSTFGGTHQISVPIVRFNEFLPDIQEIGHGVIVGQPGAEQALENNKQAFTAEFVQRARFVAAFPNAMTPAQFVDKLNTNAGNPLSAAERNQLVNDLTNGTKTRGQVLRAVAEDADLFAAETNRAFVLMQYFGYLRRNPNDTPDSDYSGYDFWLGKLNQFNGNFINAEMVKAFIVAGEYRQRFGP